MEVPTNSAQTDLNASRSTGEQVPPQGSTLLCVNPPIDDPISRILNGEPISDEEGLIPDYPPRRYDENRRPLPFTDADVLLRCEITRRVMAVIDANDQDPPGSDEKFMRGIDSHRPEGMKLFEGYY